MKYRHQRSGITSLDVTARLMTNAISTKMEGYKVKQLHMQERKHKLRLLGSSTTATRDQSGKGRRRSRKWGHPGQRLVCYQTWSEENQSRDNLWSGPLWNRHFKCRYTSVCPSFCCCFFLTTELHLFINHCEITFLLVVNHEEYEINLDILDYFPHFIDCSKIITNTNRVSATECLVWNEVARWLMDKVFTRFLRPFWLPWCWRWWQEWWWWWIISGKMLTPE